MVYYLCHWSPISPLICSIQGFSDVTSNPSSVPHYGNPTSSRWVVKVILERMSVKGAYALCIGMVVIVKSLRELLSQMCADENPQQDDHSCLNWNITDNDSIITLLYIICRILWYMAVLSQNLIALFEKQPFPGRACGLGWLMPPYIPGYMIRERVTASSYNLLQINLWLTYNDGILGWVHSKSKTRTSVLENSVKLSTPKTDVP